MNEYDSAKMADSLASTHDMTPTDDPTKANMIILNT